MASKPGLYSDRLNQDGSHSSICLTCFATVDGRKHDGRHAKHDSIHVCDSAFLAERGILTQSKPARHSGSTRRGAQVYNQANEAA